MPGSAPPRVYDWEEDRLLMAMPEPRPAGWRTKTVATWRVYMRLVDLLRPHTERTIWMFACVFLSTGFALALPTLLAWVIDVGVRHGNRGELVLAAIGILISSSL